jgi:hypothetical protein
MVSSLLARQARSPSQLTSDHHRWTSLQARKVAWLPFLPAADADGHRVMDKMFAAAGWVPDLEVSGNPHKERQKEAQQVCKYEGGPSHTGCRRVHASFYLGLWLKRLRCSLHQRTAVGCRRLEVLDVGRATRAWEARGIDRTAACVGVDTH